MQSKVIAQQRQIPKNISRSQKYLKTTGHHRKSLNKNDEQNSCWAEGFTSSSLAIVQTPQPGFFFGDFRRKYAVSETPNLFAGLGVFFCPHQYPARKIKRFYSYDQRRIPRALKQYQLSLLHFSTQLAFRQQFQIVFEVMRCNYIIFAYCLG